jgi:L,D-transpeptidase ErfK/SrfK
MDDIRGGRRPDHQTVYEDTLYDLAAKYSLGSEELIRVNPGVDPWLPGAGKKITVPGRHILPPGPREGIVVNLPEHRLYYYPKPKRGGREGHHLPGQHRQDGLAHARWAHPRDLRSRRIPPGIRRSRCARSTPPMAIRCRPSVPPGPDNPLGQYAMRLAAGNGTYLIHGTNNPIAVGLAVTHGCIRMYPDDVAALFR